MHGGSGSSAPSPPLVPVQRNWALGNPTKTVVFGFIPIHVWLDEHSRVHEVYMENNYHLQREYYKQNNVLIRHADCDGVMLIACIAESGELLSVRPAHRVDMLLWDMIFDSRRTSDLGKYHQFVLNIIV